MVTEGEGYSDKHRNEMHKLIKKVTDDYNSVGFNTAIAQMMAFVNTAYADNYITKAELTTLLQLLYPVAPHITEEINESIGNTLILAKSAWPVYDEKYLVEDDVEIPVQVLGKLKGTVTVSRDSDCETVKAAVLATSLAELIADKTVVKTIYVANKIINFIIK